MSTIIDPDAWKLGWYGKFAPFSELTDDDRELEPFGIRNRKLPLPLALQTHSRPGHTDAVPVAAIDHMVSTEAGIFATGPWLDPAAVPETSRAIALVAAGIARPSLDLVRGRSMVVEPKVGEDGRGISHYLSALCSGATMVMQPAFDGTYIRMRPASAYSAQMRETLTASGFDGELLVVDGTFALTGTTSWRSMPIAGRETPFNADQAVARIMQWANGNDAKLRSMHLIVRPEYTVGTRDRYVFPIGDIIDGRPHLVFHAIYSAAAILNGAHGGVKGVSDAERTSIQNIITQIYQRMGQAFQDPGLEAPWARRAKLPENTRTASAGVAPVAPPDTWFTTPEPDRPTVMTITADGRVFGHLAAKDTCHVGLGQLTGECVKPPRSGNGYQSFHTGTVLTASGRTVKVGRITVDTTHPVGAAGARLDAVTAAAHYDNTGTCAAIVRATDGKHGIWLSGALVPEADEAMAAKLRRHPPSGDWRRVGGNLELVAALAVNSPGYPVFGLDEEGVQLSLTASAAAGCLQDADPDTIGTMSDTDGEGQDDDVQADTTTTTTETTTGVDTQPPPAIDPEEFRRLFDERYREQRADADRLDGLRAQLYELGAEDTNRLAEQLKQLGPLDGES